LNFTYTFFELFFCSRGRFSPTQSDISQSGFFKILLRQAVFTMVTIKDISERCGVSRATVSKALNGHTDIGADTIAQVRRVAKEMGYLPNATARTLKLGRSHNIGVLFVDKTACGLTHEYFSSILDSLKLSGRLGYDITFISKGHREFSMDYYEHAKYRNCAGVVIASVDFSDPAC
jgi:LacI family transcriptional regulator